MDFALNSSGTLMEGFPSSFNLYNILAFASCCVLNGHELLLLTCVVDSLEGKEGRGVSGVWMRREKAMHAKATQKPCLTGDWG